MNSKARELLETLTLSMAVTFIFLIFFPLVVGIITPIDIFAQIGIWYTSLIFVLFTLVVFVIILIARKTSYGRFFINDQIDRSKSK
jgi:glucan phosphoethanolaminetransferase (alkaline phosphatase superfamily)